MDDYDIEGKVQDPAAMDPSEIKINPDFYIHISITNALKALSRDDIDSSFSQFRVLVETCERICRGANRLLEDYDQEVEDYLNSEEYKKAEGKVLSTMLANKKLELIIRGITKRKTLVASLSA